ncbi:protein of unknown function [Taphrina deformans PYCC 5710]|uniref:glucan 1,3-beta-glucosidase n=1 Tax=Taphrina deformans (strain PYCC 5710 / ATCC 11124 / CBS 356.35 / IMI 108563 / JCM 9778 / NBRC 8474) TaxID=1097556 RepID=R4XK89_TAPDE|nr:protein of unknown function [Taphrina deformans PYCC 5710]|eukprot:CCG83734.1 protein of unknown function [Taphrina deformans PYCC 5710]
MRFSYSAVLQVALALLPALAQSKPIGNLAEKRDLSFQYGAAKVRGVNLGGWLVLEPWIKPSLFYQFQGQSNPAVDEWTFCQNLGYANAAAQLNAHWASWYTEQDFVNFANWGLNHVRIPIGYWAFDVQNGEPWVMGAEKYLQLALVWASNHGLKVWIDLHGAPGSQNGFDNSGKYGAINWASNSANIQRTLNVLSTITSRYGSVPAVIGIELLNEPAGFSISPDIVQDFYKRGYSITQSANRVTVLHDAFLASSAFTNTYVQGAYQNVALDTHIYQIFSPDENARSHAQHLSNACAHRGNLASTNSKIWTLVGEWTAAENDCATWLNGFNKGARYDGSFPNSYYIGSCSNQNQISTMSSAKLQEVKEYIRAQLDAYETASGWFFWAGKTETADLWDFGKLVTNGLMPQPLGLQYASAAAGFCNPYPYS